MIDNMLFTLNEMLQLTGACGLKPRDDAPRAWVHRGLLVLSPRPGRVAVERYSLRDAYRVAATESLSRLGVLSRHTAKLLDAFSDCACALQFFSKDGRDYFHDILEGEEPIPALGSAIVDLPEIKRRVDAEARKILAAKGSEELTTPEAVVAECKRENQFCEIWGGAIDKPLREFFALKNKQRDLHQSRCFVTACQRLQLGFGLLGDFEEQDRFRRLALEEQSLTHN